MSKVKISLYLDPTQLRLVNEIAEKFHQRRALILREAVNCYIYEKKNERQGNISQDDKSRPQTFRVIL